VPYKPQTNGNGNGNGNGHKAFVHPLLHRQIEAGANERAYESDFTVTEQWVLDDHRIVGTAVMPGTAYLEMARAAVEKESLAGMLEIRDAFFLAPLALRDDETRQVRTIIEKENDEFSYRIVSKPATPNGDAAEWQTFSIGRLGYVDSEPAVQHDLRSIIERCNRKEVVIRDDDEFDPDLGPRWQSLQRVRVGEGELIATLELPQMFDADMEHLKLHPALLDRATGTAKHFLVNEGHYLPMGYKRLQFKGPLPRRVHTYIKQKDSGSRNETITFDIMLLDDDGVECVVIDSFSQKRVNDSTGTIKMLAGAGTRKAETASNGDADGIYQKKLASGITPDEGIEVFRRILSNETPAQVIVSTKDLFASIEQANAFTEVELIGESQKSNVPRASHPRPNLGTPYVAPRTEVEQSLANIWQQMLGIEDVSIHDNFFELGGDSVQAIQISVKINEAGLRFTPQQLFQNQTIAELAAILDTSSSTTVETPAATDSATGEFSLAGVSEDELAKIAMLIEAADELNDAVI
jgi:acyl carrier protein